MKTPGHEMHFPQRTSAPAHEGELIFAHFKTPPRNRPIPCPVKMVRRIDWISAPPHLPTIEPGSHYQIYCSPKERFRIIAPIRAIPRLIVRNSISLFNEMPHNPNTHLHANYTMCWSSHHTTRADHIWASRPLSRKVQICISISWHDYRYAKGYSNTDA